MDQSKVATLDSLTHSHVAFFTWSVWPSTASLCGTWSARSVASLHMRGERWSCWRCRKTRGPSSSSRRGWVCSSPTAWRVVVVKEWEQRAAGGLAGQLRSHGPVSLQNVLTHDCWHLLLVKRLGTPIMQFILFIPATFYTADRLKASNMIK